MIVGAAILAALQSLSGQKRIATKSDILKALRGKRSDAMAS